MAISFGTTAVALNVGISAYLLALGIFIPASGWVAARAHRVGASASQAAAFYLCAYYAGSSVFGSLGSSAWATAGWAGVSSLALTLLLISISLVGMLRRTRAPTTRPSSMGPQ